MLLKEMFSPFEGSQELEQEVDWLDDLKFFIDHNHDLLTMQMMPAIHRHKKYVGSPNAYKIYMKPLMRCVNEYCETFDVKDKDECFPVEKIEGLAKNIASVQENYIKDGQYD
jgi:hypothetical protein